MPVIQHFLRWHIRIIRMGRRHAIIPTKCSNNPINRRVTAKNRSREACRFVTRRLYGNNGQLRRPVRWPLSAHAGSLSRRAVLNIAFVATSFYRPHSSTVYASKSQMHSSCFFTLSVLLCATTPVMAAFFRSPLSYFRQQPSAEAFDPSFMETSCPGQGFTQFDTSHRTVFERGEATVRGFPQPVASSCSL